MSTCNIKIHGDDVEVEYEFDDEDLVIERVATDIATYEFSELTLSMKQQIEEKVLKYMEEKEDWVAGEADEECTRRMEARMEANWNK